MAQLISFNNPPNFPMPHVPAFQFWATRTVAIQRAGAELGVQPAFPQPQTFAQQWLIVCIANTAHAANHKTVTITPFGPTGTVTATFELTESTHSGSNIPVTIANGDSANAVATALGTAIGSWITSHYPTAFTAFVELGADVAISALDPGFRLFVTAGFAAGGVAPPLATFVQGGRMYGDGLLARAWAAFVYTGYTGTGSTTFVDAGPPKTPQILVAMYPLAMRGPKAWPGQINPTVNSRAE